MARIRHFIMGHGEGFNLSTATGVWCVEVCTCGKQRWWQW